MKFVTQHIWILFLLFLVIDFAQSNYHYSNLVMDGDMTRAAAPMPIYQDIFKDPIGIKAIQQNKKHRGAGRYVCHKITQWWFTDIYHIVKFVAKDPVHSVYYTSTLLVVLMHLLFLFLAYAYAKNKESFSFKNFLAIALTASVLIQLNEYYGSVGLIDRSITYVIFYALPVFSLLLYFLPFYKYQVQHAYILNNWQFVLLILLAPILSFSGPLIQPLVFILFVFYLFGVFIPNPFFSIKRNKKLLGVFAFLFACCLYAFYVSQYNSEDIIHKPLGERYRLMLHGFEKIMTETMAWPLLLLGIVLNVLILRITKIKFAHLLKPLFFFVFSFCLVYLILLPLGGYRVYREYIIRYDTFIPVTLGFCFLLFYTSHLLLNNLKSKAYLFYSISLLAFCAIFFIKDIKVEREVNYCEQAQMYELLNTKDTIITKPYVCDVIIWDIRDNQDPDNMEAVNVMLKHWGILQNYQHLQYYEEEK